MNSNVFWFTGLSGAGKTSVATKALELLKEEGNNIVLLDGDIVRHGLCKDLNFTLVDREENIRRVAEVAKIFNENNTICLCTFISPTLKIRDLAKNIIGAENFHEIYINTPIEICENRDTKGLYQKVRNGEIKNFTGIDSIYEIPVNPKYTLNCFENTIHQSVNEIIDFIKLKSK